MRPLESQEIEGEVGSAEVQRFLGSDAIVRPGWACVSYTLTAGSFSAWGRDGRNTEGEGKNVVLAGTKLARSHEGKYQP